MGAVGLQTHIWNNNIRSALLLAGFPVLLLGLVYALAFAMVGAGYLPGSGDVAADAGRMMLGAAPLALIVTGVWFAVAWFANTAIIDAVTGARPVTRREAPELYNLLENLCVSRGIRTPGLHIIDDPAMNAFASGVHDGQYAVTVTTGLLAALDRDELEAVLAHELTHIISRDVRTMVIASVFAGVITLVAQIVFRAIMWGGVGRGRRDEGDRRGAGIFIIVALAAAAIGAALAVVIRMSLSRTREFVADAGAAELTKNPDAMIRALQKISGGSKLEAPESVQGMFIDNAPSQAAFGLLDTHPPIEKRIEALVRYAGGRISDPVSEPWSSAPDASSGPWGAAADEESKGPWG